MRKLLLTTFDGVMVVDGIGANVPEIMNRTDGLRAIDWDGTRGRMVWEDRDEIFTGIDQIQGFLDFWDTVKPWRRML